MYAGALVVGDNDVCFRISGTTATAVVMNNIGLVATGCDDDATGCNVGSDFSCGLVLAGKVVSTFSGSCPCGQDR